MKTLNANSLNIQKNNNIFIIENIFLFKLFDQSTVIEIVSTTTIKMNGDLTIYLSSGDEILFPNIDFSNGNIIDTISYNSGTDETTIIFTIALISSVFLNSNISLKIDITDRLLKDGISDVVNKVEGVKLNNFDSGKLDFFVDNKDGYFSNKTKTGLIDDGDIFYVKYLLKFKASSQPDMIYFGGILSLTDSQPDYYNKTYFFRALGHSKELERYSSFNVTDTVNKDLSIISGIEIVEFTPSTDSEVGVKKIEYKPFVSTNPLSGVSVVSVSIDTTPGVKKLEFMYPNSFKWDNGAWTDVVNTDLDAEGNKRIYAKDGSGDVLFITLNFGKQNELNSFPDLDMEVWMNVLENVVDAGDKVVTEYGEPKISYDGGISESIKIHFARIVKWDSDLDVYTDITDLVNEGYKLDLNTDLFDEVDDVLFIIAPEKFWAMEMLLSLDGGGDAGNVYDFQYSQGGILFSVVMNFANSGFVDGTSGLTQSGILKWNDLSNWTMNNIGTNDGESFKGYMIKITNTTWVDSPKIQELKKVLRLRGKTGDYLQLKFYQDKIYTKDAIDEVVIKDVNGTLTPSIWYQNITIKQLLELTLDQANYTTDDRYLTDLKIIKANRYFNIWGKPPKRNYLYNPSSVVIDSTNKYVYIATKTDIWRCHITGTWELVVSVKYEYPIAEQYMFIKKFWISKDDGLLYIYSEFIQKPILPYVSQVNYVGFFHSYDLGTETLTLINGTSFLYDGLKALRNGCRYYNGASYTDVIGHGWNNSGGGSISINRGSENLCVPFEQILRIYRAGDTDASCAIMIDLADDLSGYMSFLFHSIFNEGGLFVDKNGPEYNAKNNYLCIENSGIGVSDQPMNLLIDYNQKGNLIVIDKVGNDADIYIVKRNEDSDSNICYYLYSMKNLTKLGWKSYNEQHHPISHHYDSDNEIFYLGYTVWGDRATGTGASDAAIPAYSYITKLKLNVKVGDFGNVAYYNAGTGIYNDKTTLANAGSPLGTIFQATNDSVIFGSIKKIRQIYMNLEDNANTYDYQYWNGTTFVNLPNVGNGFKDDDKIISFSIPNDWQTEDHGFGDFYYVWMKCTSYLATPTHTNCQLRERVIWDSIADNTSGDGMSRYMPTWMVLNIAENTIHGCLFNRQSTDTFPYQWCYFVLDLTSEILYPSRTGDNFNFDASYSYKDFIYNSFDGFVYCFAESKRHKEKIGFLVKAEYDSGTNAITLTKEGEPRNKEWGNVDLSFDDENGNIYGISKDKEYSLWEYSTEFYQRIEVANFSSVENIRNIINELALFSNCMYIIHSERFIRFIKRDEYNGTIDLTWDENVLTEKPDVVNWEHFYDAVKVEYRSLIIEDDGDKKAGYTGWLKKIMDINSILIQNEHIAKLVADNLYDFYSKYRLNIKELKTIPLIQLELLDKYNLFMPANIIDLDEITNFLIIGISKRSDFNIVLESLEIVEDEPPIIIS